MSLLRQRPWVACLSLLLLLLTGPSGVQGYVWCLGEDGHAAFEEASSGLCGPSSHHDHAAEAAAPEVDTDHCGPCLDLSIGPDATSRRLQEPLALALVAVASPPLFLPFVADYPSQAPAEAEPAIAPLPPLYLLCQRTVVLLN